MKQVLCLYGDSIAWGSGDPDKGGWGARLKHYFDVHLPETRLYNCSVFNDDTDALLKRFQIETQARLANCVLFAVGVNDARYSDAEHTPYIPLDRFERNVLELIRQAKELVDHVVFLGLTPVDESKTMPLPSAPDQYFVEDRIALYNAKLRELCAREGVHFIEMLDTLNAGELEDGVHPNSLGHEKIFLKVKEYYATHFNSS